MYVEDKNLLLMHSLSKNPVELSFHRWKTQIPAVCLIFFGWSFLVILNCYLTQNPYSANHSGNASIFADVFSEKWRISPAWFVILVSALVVFLTGKGFPSDLFIPLTLFTMWVSGLVTNDIPIHSKTYLYDSILLVLCAMVAYRDAKTRFRSTTWQKNIFTWVFVLMAVGAILSWLRPETFGHFGNFSRSTRGEVTLWSALGLRAFLSAFAVYGLIVVKKWYLKILWILPWFSFTLVSLMAFTRGGVIADVSGLLIIFILYRRSRAIVPIIAVFSLFLAGDFILDFIFIGKKWSNYWYSEPRVDLWRTHLEAILSSPLFGVGRETFSQEFAYEIYGSSEVGMLSWGSRSGMIYAACMGFLVIRGFFYAVKLFSIGTKDVNNDFLLDILCPIVVFTGFIVNVFNGYNRILEFETLAYYYAIFYCYYRIRMPGRVRY